MHWFTPQILKLGVQNLNKGIQALEASCAVSQSTPQQGAGVHAEEGDGKQAFKLAVVS